MRQMKTEQNPVYTPTGSDEQVSLPVMNSVSGGVEVLLHLFIYAVVFKVTYRPITVM